MASGNTDKSHLWKPGKSANPSGRPKMPEHIYKALRGKLTDKSLEVLENILEGKEGRSSDRLKAAELVMDRAWGKAPQIVDAEVSTSQTVDISNLTKEQQQGLIALATAQTNQETD